MPGFAAHGTGALEKIVERVAIDSGPEAGVSVTNVTDSAIRRHMPGRVDPHDRGYSILSVSDHTTVADLNIGFRCWRAGTRRSGSWHVVADRPARWPLRTAGDATPRPLMTATTDTAGTAGTTDFRGGWSGHAAADT
jgi:hypothetical protein